jgi:hypothetical protein
MPIRIQRSRARGFRMPEGAVYVGRPTKFGNPYKVLDPGEPGHREAVEQYRRWLNGSLPGQEIKAAAEIELKGKDLACFCPLQYCCHADVLLEIANGPRKENG